jgi:hypothetical protein
LPCRQKHHSVYTFLSPGYPINHDFDYGALAQLQHFVINNCGDPFIECNYAVHSRQFEVGVLDWFARLWALNTNDYWGYVTSGGTEGNMHGILSGLVYTVTIYYWSNHYFQIREKVLCNTSDLLLSITFLFLQKRSFS